ncbi:AMP-binding enzyme, partial [Proteus mirabilis]|uniref:AMP-binding enzyme n=1 Tax=Proteus mirabilis TaxID=584 RepID=UPI0013D47BEC
VGETGEIFMRIHYYPDFTYHNQDEKRREIDRDGLITCGDVGYFDEDGFLYICDRKRDMVISGGVNIYPAEIENTLIGMDGVRDCAVFGVPDDEYGERLFACVEPDT